MTSSLSISEEHGIAALPADAMSVYSIGVSTAGSAEVRMARANPRRHIIASTIDEQGATDSRKMVKSYGLDDRIEIKLEDIASDLPYSGDTFDYIYARLVLHYLDKQQLTKALSELYRVLRPNGIFFVVVRSTNNIDATERASDYDEQTGLTTYTTRPGSELSDVRKRFFHTPETISHYLEAAGFTVTQNIQYDERLYHDYGRTLLSQNVDNLVEVTAKK